MTCIRNDLLNDLTVRPLRSDIGALWENWASFDQLAAQVGNRRLRLPRSGLQSIFPKENHPCFFDPGSMYHEPADLHTRSLSATLRTDASPMTDLTIELPEDLSEALKPYRDHLDELLRMGLREFKMAQSLGIYQRGGISLWKAARMAGVSLQEMARYAAAQGVQPSCDEEMVAEELA